MLESQSDWLPAELNQIRYWFLLGAGSDETLTAEVGTLPEYERRMLAHAAQVVLTFVHRLYAVEHRDEWMVPDDEKLFRPEEYRTNEKAVWKAIVREQREEPLPTSMEAAMGRAFATINPRDGETEGDGQQREDLAILAEELDQDLSHVMVEVLGLPEDTPLPELPEDPDRARALDEWLRSGLDILAA